MYNDKRKYTTIYVHAHMHSTTNIQSIRLQTSCSPLSPLLPSQPTLLWAIMVHAISEHILSKEGVSARRRAYVRAT